MKSVVVQWIALDHLQELHITQLRLLGLDDNKPTCFFGGRFKQLSQFGGEVIKESIA